MARNTRTYSDIDFNFNRHPVTKDLIRRYDENAIKASIKNLVLTNNYERPFHSEIGSPIRKLLFDLATPMFAITLKRSIMDVINNFEPRVELLDVIINDQTDSNAVYVRIEFKIINTQIPVSLDLLLERTR